MLSAQSNSIVKPQMMAQPSAKDTLQKPSPDKNALNKSVVVKTGTLENV